MELNICPQSSEPETKTSPSAGATCAASVVMGGPETRLAGTDEADVTARSVLDGHADGERAGLDPGGGGDRARQARDAAPDVRQKARHARRGQLLFRDRQRLDVAAFEHPRRPSPAPSPAKPLRQRRGFGRRPDLRRHDLNRHVLGRGQPLHVFGPRHAAARVDHRRAGTPDRARASSRRLDVRDLGCRPRCPARQHRPALLRLLHVEIDEELFGGEAVAQRLEASAPGEALRAFGRSRLKL